MFYEDLIERGSQAEQAKRYVDGLMDRVKGIICDHIINLNPDETLKFTVYKSQLLCLGDIMATVDADIREGSRQIEIAQGTPPEQNGIL